MFDAKISPFCKGKDLSLKECRYIVISIRKILKKAIVAGGSTFKDYVSTDGTIGSFQNDFKVYNRSGKKIGGKIIKKVNSSKRPLLIFPQGTRVSPEDRPNFKKGTGRIYETLKIKCQPVALNSGYVWPKNKALSNNKTIKISILKPIEPGLKKEDFLNLLEDTIYSELDKIN